MNIYQLSKRLFLLFIIFNLSIGNKQLMFGPLKISQLLIWVAIISASMILINYNKRFWLSLLIISFVLFFRTLGFISPVSLTLYYILVAILYSLVGVVIFTQNMNMIYKQVMFIALINMVFQLIQLLGVWEWSYLFTTFGEISPGNTLFVELKNLIIDKSQLRPSGIFPSPMYQSIFIGLAIALHFTRKNNRIPFGSIMIILMIIFSNSKYPIIGFFLISFLVLIIGTSQQKGFILKSLSIYIGVLIIYYNLFPGVVEMTLVPRLWLWSFFTRFNNLIQLLYPFGNVPYSVLIFTEGTAKAHHHKSGDYIASGFALLVLYRSLIIYIIPILIVFIIKYIKSYKYLLRINPTNKLVFPLACAIITITFPAMFDIFKNPLYWLITGGTIIPIFLSLKKSMFHISKVFYYY